MEARGRGSSRQKAQFRGRPHEPPRSAQFSDGFTGSGVTPRHQDWFEIFSCSSLALRKPSPRIVDYDRDEPGPKARFVVVTRDWYPADGFHTFEEKEIYEPVAWCALRREAIAEHLACLTLFFDKEASDLEESRSRTSGFLKSSAVLLATLASQKCVCA